MPAPEFTFYTKPQYFADLVERLGAAKPGDRFMTANMITRPWHPEVAAVLAAMTAAAQRGVEVALITDARNFLIDDDGHLFPGPFLFHRKLPRSGMASRFQMQRDLFEALKAAGGRYVILNLPKHLLSNPYAGRFHIKFTVINDDYYIGGCNLESHHNLDLMVRTTDARVANWLADLGERLFVTSDAEATIGQDQTYEGTPGVTFFLDAGARHRSIILRQALDFIDAAREHVTITCQFFPGGITARHLAAAHKRGVKVDIIYNRPPQNGTILTLGFIAAEMRERLRNPADFFSHSNSGPDYVHVKLIATEQGAMVGSHNFVQAGVSLGTAEVAMLVRDPEFARRAVETVMQQLPAAPVGQ